MSPAPLKRVDDFDSDKVILAGIGLRWTATGSATSNLDYKFTEARLLTGGELLLFGHSEDDKASLQVVDVDNVLGLGAGTIVRQPLKDWRFSSDTQRQNGVASSFPVSIPANLYLRLVYTATGVSAVTVKLNLMAYKVID